MLVSCKQYRGLGEFLRDWKEWPTRDAKEDEEDEENEEDEEEQISLTEATFLLPGTGLDDITIKRLKKLKLSPLPFLERVIIVQKQPFRKALDFADLLSALTSVLSAELLPGLRSIIWVLPKDAVQESSLWPGSAGRPTFALLSELTSPSTSAAPDPFSIGCSRSGTRTSSSPSSERGDWVAPAGCHATLVR